MIVVNPMMNKVGVHQLYQPLERLSSAKQKSSLSFKEILQETQKPTISKHAAERLHERNIAISEAKWNEISVKMQEAKAKGITDSLVFTKEAAMVVSTKNHTVVTVMDPQDSASQIFTNINGAIVLNS